MQNNPSSNPKDKIRFVRIRGKVVPIRSDQKVQNRKSGKFLKSTKNISRKEASNFLTDRAKLDKSESNRRKKFAVQGASLSALSFLLTRGKSVGKEGRLFGNVLSAGLGVKAGMDAMLSSSLSAAAGQRNVDAKSIRETGKVSGDVSYIGNSAQRARTSATTISMFIKDKKKRKKK